MLQWYFILFFSRDHVLTVLYLAPIFLGGGELGILGGGGSFYPSNTLVRTLDCNTQEKWKTMVMQNFGGENKVHYGRCASGV